MRKSRRALVANVLMALGVLVWLTGELTGVGNNASAGKDSPDTTTQWVQLFIHHHPLIAMGLLFGGFAVLMSHFLDWPQSKK